MSRVLVLGGMTRTLTMFRMPMLRAMVAAAPCAILISQGAVSSGPSKKGWELVM